MPALARLSLLIAFACVACRGQQPVPADLSASIDSLLPRLEVLSGLEAREPVRVAWRNQRQLRAYVTAQLEEELPPDELSGIRASYRAFGLIPDTLDLRRLLLELYAEQVMGYYDPETDTLYLMEGVSREVLQPVLAHELVHALQDQHVDLDSLISRAHGASAGDTRAASAGGLRSAPPGGLRSNDRQTAAQAAIEGHATLVMFTLLAERQLGSTVDPRMLPDLGAQLRPALEAQNAQFPVFRSAPRVIREALLFPYLSGAAFVQALWRAGARSSVGGVDGPGDPPLGELLPLSTEQVLHPAARFIETRDAPTELTLAPMPDSAASGASWHVLYENTLGELEMRILLAEHLGPDAADLAAGWDGDRYRLLEDRSRTGGSLASGGGAGRPGTAPEPPAGAGRALVWYSVWDDATAADEFADAYRRILAAREGRHGRVERLELDGRPAVRIVDAERTVALGDVPIPAVVRLTEVER